MKTSMKNLVRSCVSIVALIACSTPAFASVVRTTERLVCFQNTSIADGRAVIEGERLTNGKLRIEVVDGSSRFFIVKKEFEDRHNNYVYIGVETNDAGVEIANTRLTLSVRPGGISDLLFLIHQRRITELFKFRCLISFKN